MNLFPFKINILRKSKIVYSLVLFFIIFRFFYIHFSSLEKSSAEIILSGRTLVDEQFFGEYTYRYYTWPRFRENIFQINKGNELVYIN